MLEGDMNSFYYRSVRKRRFLVNPISFRIDFQNVLVNIPLLSNRNKTSLYQSTKNEDFFLFHNDFNMVELKNVCINY